MNPLIGWSWWALVAVGSDGQELDRVPFMMRPECEHAIYQRSGEPIRSAPTGGHESIAYTVTDKRGRRVTFTCQPEVSQ